MKEYVEFVRKFNFSNVTANGNSVFFEYANKYNIEITKTQNSFITRILNWDKEHPFNHINKHGNLCLDSKINRYDLPIFPTKEHLENLKDILNGTNELVDSIRDFKLNCIRQNITERIISDDNIKEIPQNTIKQEYAIKIKNNNFSDLPKWLQDSFPVAKCSVLFIQNKDINKEVGLIKIDNQILHALDCRQKTLISKTGGKTIEGEIIVIIGLGSLGSEVFEQLRLSGYKNFILADYDFLDEKNTYRWSMYAEPQNKAALLKERYEHIMVYQPNIFGNLVSVRQLNIWSVVTKDENNQTNEIIDLISRSKLNKIKIINCTANDDSILESAKLLKILKRKHEVELDILFMEENGFFAHLLTLNGKDSNPANKINKFQDDWKNSKIQCMKTSNKYLYDEGCVGETQVYSQNSSKYFAMKWNLMYTGEKRPTKMHTVLKNELVDFEELTDELTMEGEKYALKKKKLHWFWAK